VGVENIGVQRVLIGFLTLKLAGRVVVIQAPISLSPDNGKPYLIAIGAAYGMPNDMDMSQGFVLSNYCNDVISTEYQTVNPNLDAYLPSSSIKP
jgi:hypothetical protein